VNTFLFRVAIRAFEDSSGRITPGCIVRRSLTRYTCMYEPGPLPLLARYHCDGTSGTWPGESSYIPVVNVSDGRVGQHAG
jgi:hypothetical protein